MTHVILDCEFHPLPNTYPNERLISPNEIIQLGMVVLDENMTQIATYFTHVKPKYISKVNKKIHKLTGITTSDLETAPSLEEVLVEISRLLDDHVNVRFYTWSDSDLNQLRRESQLKGINLPSVMSRKRWVDLQRIYTRLLHYTHNLSLKDAIYFTDFGYDPNSLHSAIYDAHITACLLKLTHSKEQFAMRTKYVRESFDPIYSRTTLGEIFGNKLGYIFA